MCLSRLYVEDSSFILNEVGRVIYCTCALFFVNDSMTAGKCTNMRCLYMYLLWKCRRDMHVG